MSTIKWLIICVLISAGFAVHAHAADYNCFEKCSEQCPGDLSCAIGCITYQRDYCDYSCTESCKDQCPSGNIACMVQCEAYCGKALCGPEQPVPNEHMVGICNTACQQGAPVKTGSQALDVCMNYSGPVTTIVGIMTQDFSATQWLSGDDCSFSDNFQIAMDGSQYLDCSNVRFSEAFRQGWVFWLVSPVSFDQLDWQSGDYELLFYQIPQCLSGDTVIQGQCVSCSDYCDSLFPGNISAIVNCAAWQDANCQPTPCPINLPDPVVSFVGTENYTDSNGNALVRYRLTVVNRHEYPDSLFSPAPDLPPCMPWITNSSRTWVDFLDQDDRHIGRHCGIGSAEDMGGLEFSVLAGTDPPSGVRVVLNDRLCEKEYRSELVEISPDVPDCNSEHLSLCGSEYECLLAGGYWYSSSCNASLPPPPHTYTNSLGMTFNLIPAGTFMMGSPEDELGRNSNETQHQVTLTRSFYIQTTEVTQAQWEAVMGNNPSYFSQCGGSCPVEQVSWNDVQDFIAALNSRGGGTYRLPTEAEWEYAARAGSTTAFANGDITVTDCGLDPNLDAMGWYCGNSAVTYDGCYDYSYRGGPSCAGTHPVAQKLPNAWGLYDMHGNLLEWVQDWYGSYPTIAMTDPTGPETGSARVIRGGGWGYGARYCRSANRSNRTPAYRYSFIGFRLLLNPKNNDFDGDGYTENQGDCNDLDSAVYPGAPEICGDGIDQDCNGFDEACDSDSIPALYSPPNDAILDNGCRNFSDPLIWDFDWSDVPGAEAYQLYVISDGYQNPGIDDSSIPSSSYRRDDYGYSGTGPWRWKVRAKVYGRWGDWSEERTFYVEPVNTDCPTISGLELVKEIPVDSYGVTGLDVYFDTDRQYIVYGHTSGNDQENSLVIYNYKEDEIIKIVDAQNWNFTIHFFNNGHNLAYSNLRTLYILDDNFDTIRTIPTGYIRDFSISNDNKILALYNYESNNLEIYDIENDFSLTHSYSVEHDVFSYSGASRLGISNSGRLVALAGGYENGSVLIYDLENGTQKKLFTSSTSGSYSPAFFNNDRYLAIGGGYQSGIIDILDIENDIVINTIGAFNNYVYSIDASSDQRYLIAGGYDAIIKLYDTSDWTVLSSDYQHNCSIEHVLFSNDMKYVVSASNSSPNASKILIHKIQ